MRKPTDRYTSLLPVNKKAIHDFIVHDSARGIKPRTVGNHESLLISFVKSLNPEKSFKAISLSDIEKALTSGRWKPTSQEIIKQVLRGFLIFHKRKKLASQITLNCKLLTTTTKTIEDILTPDEIQRLINTSLEPMYRAMIEVFLLTTGRLGEMQKLRVGSVVFGDITIWVNVRISKTKIRRIPCVPDEKNPCAFFPSNLESWILSHPYRNDPEAPLFYSRYRDKVYYGKPMSEGGIRDVIKRCSREAGITKKVTPHILRHTSASYFGQHLNENMLCTKCGWKIGSAMARRYCHVDEKSLEKQLIEQAGILKDENPRRKEIIENQQLKTKVDSLEATVSRMMEMLNMQDNAWLEQKKAEEEAYKQMLSERAEFEENINQEFKKPLIT